MRAKRDLIGIGLTPWARGAPPRGGWWNASTSRDADCRRFWNAEVGKWSAPVFVGDPDTHAEVARATRGESGVRTVEWRGLIAERGREAAGRKAAERRLRAALSRFDKVAAEATALGIRV